jgi:O-methyltransferase involved in polyketide biosynthesis
MTSSARISPTAHYTGQVWFRNGLADPAFATREGERLYRLLVPFNVALRSFGGPTVDGMLLARHRAIDHLLKKSIEEGTVGQVIEMAAGLSPRGWRMSRVYPELRYIEADLPGMIARKRDVLERAAPVGPGHELVEIDALADAGPMSIEAIAGRLDPSRGAAIITEGLLNYFPGETTVKMWRRFGAALARFPAGLYLADLVVSRDSHSLSVRIFCAALAVFVRGGIYFDFADDAVPRRELEIAGFTSAELRCPLEFTSMIGEVEPAGARQVRIIEARRL